MQTTLRYLGTEILDAAAYQEAGGVYNGHDLVKTSTGESLDLYRAQQGTYVT